MTRVAILLALAVVLLTTIFLSATGIIRYRTYAVCGFAKDEQEFYDELQSERLRPVFVLPKPATEISYFIQPRIGRLFMKCSTEESRVVSWVDTNSIAFSRISEPITIEWLEAQTTGSTSIFISNGITGEIRLLDCQFAYDKDSQTFYFWSNGLSH